MTDNLYSRIKTRLDEKAAKAERSRIASEKAAEEWRNSGLKRAKEDLKEIEANIEKDAAKFIDTGYPDYYYLRDVDKYYNEGIKFLLDHFSSMGFRVELSHSEGGYEPDYGNISPSDNMIIYFQ